MIVLLSVVACIVPTALYVSLIYWVDRYEREPAWLLAAMFLWGAVPAIVAALIFNFLLGMPFYYLGGEAFGLFATGAFVAPLVEESIKGLGVLAVVLLRRHDIDSPLDGIIYGAMVGMGFAMVENFFYFMEQYELGGMEAWGTNILFRAGVFGLNHALFSALTGLGLAVGRLAHQPALRWLAPLLGWGTGVFIHFFHNFMVSFNPLLCLLAWLVDWGGVTVVAIIIVWALAQERRWIRDYLADEVALGTVSAEQLALAAAPVQRARHLARQWRAHGWQHRRQASRYFYHVSKLAYRKHHNARAGLDHDDDAVVTRLRGEIAGLSRYV